MSCIGWYIAVLGYVAVKGGADIKEMLKRFKIHVSKIFLTDEEEKEDLASLKENAPEVAEKMLKIAGKKDEKYTLDHSIVVYLMGPDNEFITYLGSNLSDTDMAKIILDEVSADMKKAVMAKRKETGL